MKDIEIARVCHEACRAVQQINGETVSPRARVILAM